ncbi:TonB-dependent receptor plug domain-containing protein [Hydrogenimonas cancrithermarum]|uniref:TonB-dependent receptor n=1 Tax=Hydrogenimonas cancrithermarum TaxID=2993563 RepID=A0ABM8FHP0_9BACT|nr:TonB-dependent receptor [Hydrogenimonas cancrithermarum]BDY11789.1 hypothetical protein HCR_01010 [Hydrogenimonas cancrithermarum]
MGRSIIAAMSALLALQTVYADESIDTLLKQYRKEADLSKQTKKESAGYLVVYTRDDLERMQVYRLSDLIKSIRFIRYDINNYGMTDPLQLNPLLYSSDMIKVFVNNHEISDGFFGSGLALYGNIDMGMFDHVEIYTGAPVLDVTTEPAAAVIKLYTKIPERENGGTFSMRLGERGTQELTLSHAQVMDEWSYFAYAEGAVNNFKHEQNIGYDISRDYKQFHLYGDIHLKNHRIEVEALDQKHDLFTGQSVMITPTDGEWQAPLYRLSYSGEWWDGVVKSDFSYISSVLDFDNESASPFWMQLPLAIPFDSNDNHFLYRSRNDMATVKLFHDEVVRNHTLKGGVEYRYKGVSYNYFEINDYDVTPSSDATYNTFSIFLEDHYKLNGHAMFVGSLKLNRIFFDQRPNNDRLDTWQGRIGYISLQDNWSFKGFLTHTETPPEYYNLLIHHAELVSEKYDTASLEVKRTTDRSEVRLLGLFTRARDSFVIRNSDTDKTDFFNLAFDVIFHLNENHRIDFDIYLDHFNETSIRSFKNYVGGYVRLLDTFDQWDIFNEVIFKQGTDHVKAGYDYSAGIKYHVEKDLTFALKGTNIFNKAKNSYYRTLDLTQNPPVEGGVILPVADRQIFFTMEWLF